jgi:hypothetical protein
MQHLGEFPFMDQLVQQLSCGLSEGDLAQGETGGHSEQSLGQHELTCRSVCSLIPIAVLSAINTHTIEGAAQSLRRLLMPELSFRLHDLQSSTPRRSPVFMGERFKQGDQLADFWHFVLMLVRQPRRSKPNLSHFIDAG